MKVAAEKLNIKPEFKPFHLTIAVESEEEMNAIYSIFNHSLIVEWFHDETGFSLAHIRKEMERMHGECPKYGVAFGEMLRALEDES